MKISLFFFNAFSTIGWRPPLISNIIESNTQHQKWFAEYLIDQKRNNDLKNIYLELKSNYVIDGKYLAVVTKNGLWIKDKIDNKIIITNSSTISENYIIDNFITEFDENFNVLRNIKSKKIDISKIEIYRGDVSQYNSTYFG